MQRIVGFHNSVEYILPLHNTSADLFSMSKEQLFVMSRRRDYHEKCRKIAQKLSNDDFERLTKMHGYKRNLHLHIGFLKYDFIKWYIHNIIKDM